ncbi:MAG: hypothetical protein AAF639_07750 [Chloroflexota bacterium]
MSKHWIVSVFLLGVTLLSIIQLNQGFAAHASVYAQQGTARSLIPAGCIELVVNGGFEQFGSGWNIFDSERPPKYVQDITFAGSSYSILVGNSDLVENIPSTSIIHQTVTLPTDVQRIIFTFHYYPIHYDMEPVRGDVQFMRYYNAFTNHFEGRAMSDLQDERRWIMQQRDLTARAGQRIRLEFGVINDGIAGRTAMYIDNVSILACDEETIVLPTQVPIDNPTATPTENPDPIAIPTIDASPVSTQTATTEPIPTTPAATPTPTHTAIPPTLTPTLMPTPLPTKHQGCLTQFYNGGFESSGYWIFGGDPRPPRYIATEQKSEARSVLMGNTPGNENDILSYSSVRQLVAIPKDAHTAEVRWWHYSRSEESASESPNRFHDRQELILLDINLQTLAIVYRVRQINAGWQQEFIDLTPYRGQAFYLYFNVFNDGNGRRTWMYLDDVTFSVCYRAVTPTPNTLFSDDTQSARPTQTNPPTAIPTPTPTQIRPVRAPTDTPTLTTDTSTTQSKATVQSKAVDTADTPTPEVTEVTASNTTNGGDSGGFSFDAPETLPATPSNTSIWQRLGTVGVLASILVMIGGVSIFLIRLLNRPDRPY